MIIIGFCREKVSPTICGHKCIQEPCKKISFTPEGWVLRSGRGKLRETGSTPAAPPATSRATNPRQHRPKDLSKTRRDVHLVKIKYCEDTRPQNQLNAAKEQHKDLRNILQGASVTLHIIFLGVVAQFTTLTTWSFSGNWVLILK